MVLCLLVMILQKTGRRVVTRPGVRDNNCCRMTFQYEKILLTALSFFVFDDVPSQLSARKQPKYEPGSAINFNIPYYNTALLEKTALL